MELLDSLIISISDGMHSIESDFLHGDMPHGKAVFYTTTFSWVCPVMPSHTQTCLGLPRVLWAFLGKKII